MEDSQSNTSECSHSVNEKKIPQWPTLKETKDLRVEITRVGYLGSDPDKCKLINLTKIKVSTVIIGLKVGL